MFNVTIIHYHVVSSIHVSWRSFNTDNSETIKDSMKRFNDKFQWKDSMKTFNEKIQWKHSIKRFNEKI